MARYRKIEVATWNDEKFCELSPAPPNGQTLWLYLLTGPRTTSFPGLVVGRAEVMASDLRWPLEPFKEAFGEASAKALVKADWKAGLVVLKKALFDSAGEPRDTAKPASPNVIKQWAKSWDEIPDCPLKYEYLQSLESFTEALGEAYLKAYREGFRKALAKGYPNPSPNQKQEQEQKEYTGALAPVVSLPARRLRRKVDLATGSWLEFATAAVSEINTLASKSYKPDSEETLKNSKRLVEANHTCDEARVVVRSKREWLADDKMRKHFNPTTLLRPSNFKRYLEDVNAGNGAPKTLRVAAPSDDEPDLTYSLINRGAEP